MLGQREQEIPGAGHGRFAALLLLFERIEPRGFVERRQLRRDQLHRLQRSPSVGDGEDGLRIEVVLRGPDQPHALDDGA